MKIQLKPYRHYSLTFQALATAKGEYLTEGEIYDLVYNMTTTPTERYRLLSPLERDYFKLIADAIGRQLPDWFENIRIEESRKGRLQRVPSDRSFPRRHMEALQKEITEKSWPLSRPITLVELGEFFFDEQHKEAHNEDVICGYCLIHQRPGRGKPGFALAARVKWFDETTKRFSEESPWESILARIKEKPRFGKRG